MGFSRRRKTSLKVDVPAAARIEIKYLFLYEIVSRVEQCTIPGSLMINFDQRPLKLFSVEIVRLQRKIVATLRSSKLQIRDL